MKEPKNKNIIEKPPIGIEPKNVWESIRFKRLKEAMIRYLEADLNLPDEWKEEYNEFINRLKK